MAVSAHRLYLALTVLGKCDFVRWVGASSSDNCNAFYTDSRAIAAFKRYIRYLLTHKNAYTGKTMANEPAVLAFEVRCSTSDSADRLDWQRGAMAVRRARN